MALERLLAVSSTGGSKQLTDSDTARLGRIGALSATGPASVVLETASGSTGTLSSSAWTLSSGIDLVGSGAADITGFANISVSSGKLTAAELESTGGDLTLDSNNASDSTITMQNAGAGGLTVNIAGDVGITGDLDVQGTLTTINTTNLAVADRFIEHNAGYIASPAVTSGDVYTIDPDTGVQSAVDTGGFVAGVAATTDCDVTVASSASFAVGDLVAVTGANDANNDGLYEVASIPDGTSLRLSGQLTANGEDFTKDDFTTDTTVAGTVTKVAVGVFQFTTTGTAQVAFGATTPLTFNNLATGGATSFQQAYDAGNAVQLSDASGDMTIDIDDTGTRADFIVRNEAATANYLATDSTNTTLDLGSSTLTVDILAGTLNMTGNPTVNGGTGQWDFGGNVDANAGLDVSGGALTIASQAITQTGSGQVDFAGNVDASAGVDIDADNQSLTIGAGADLSISHNGTDTTITSATGDLIIDNTNATGSTIIRLGTDTSATDFQVQGDGGTARFTVDGAATSVTANAHLFALGRIDTIGASALELGDANATSVLIADASVTTTIQGDLNVDEEVVFDSYLDFAAIASPGAPANGFGRVYVETVSTVEELWFDSDGATPVQITSNGELNIGELTGLAATTATKFTFNSAAVAGTTDVVCLTMLDGDGTAELMAWDQVYDTTADKFVVSQRLSSVTQGEGDRAVCFQLGSDTVNATGTATTSQLKLTAHTTGDAVGAQEEVTITNDPAATEVNFAAPADFIFDFNRTVNFDVNVTVAGLITTDNIDATSAGLLEVGKSTATGVVIADASVNTTVEGDLTVDEEILAGSYIDITAIASPGAPANGVGRVYVETVSTVEELWFDSDGASPVQITSNGVLNTSEINANIDDIYTNGRTWTNDLGPWIGNGDGSTTGGFYDLNPNVIAETDYQIDISWTAIAATFAVGALNLNWSGLASLTNAADAIMINGAGITNGGAGNSVFAKVTGFDVAFDVDDPSTWSDTMTIDGGGLVVTGGTVDIDVASDFSSGITNSAGEFLISGGNFQLNDNIVMTFGTDNDASWKWDSANEIIEVLPAVNDTGGFYIGDGTTDFDVRIHLGAATDYVGFDVGAKQLMLDNVDFFIGDNDLLIFGDGNDFVANFDTASGNVQLTFGGTVSKDEFYGTNDGSTGTSWFDSDTTEIASLDSNGAFQADSTIRSDGGFVGNSIDTITGTILTVGPATATKIEIGDASIEIEFQGPLDVQEDATLASGVDILFGADDTSNIGSASASPSAVFGKQFVNNDMIADATGVAAGDGLMFDTGADKTLKKSNATGFTTWGGVALNTAAVGVTIEAVMIGVVSVTLGIAATCTAGDILIPQGTAGGGTAGLFEPASANSLSPGDVRVESMTSLETQAVPNSSTLALTCMNPLTTTIA